MSTIPQTKNSRRKNYPAQPHAIGNRNGEDGGEDKILRGCEFLNDSLNTYIDNNQHNTMKADEVEMSENSMSAHHEIEGCQSSQNLDIEEQKQSDVKIVSRRELSTIPKTQTQMQADVDGNLSTPIIDAPLQSHNAVVPNETLLGLQTTVNPPTSYLTQYNTLTSSFSRFSSITIDGNPTLRGGEIGNEGESHSDQAEQFEDDSLNEDNDFGEVEQRDRLQDDNDDDDLDDIEDILSTTSAEEEDRNFFCFSKSLQNSMRMNNLFCSLSSPPLNIYLEQYNGTRLERMVCILWLESSRRTGKSHIVLG